MKTNLISRLTPALLTAFFFNIYPARAQQLPAQNEIGAADFRLNPALTGAFGIGEIAASHRSDWNGFDRAPRASMLSAQVPFFEKNVALGAFLDQERTGYIRQTGFGLAFAYHFRPGLSSDDLLSGGMLLEGWRVGVDVAELLAAHSNDPLLDNLGDPIWADNVGAGFLYQTKQARDESAWLFGAACLQLAQLERLPGRGKSSPHWNAVLGRRATFDFWTLHVRLWVDGTIGARLFPLAWKTKKTFGQAFPVGWTSFCPFNSAWVFRLCSGCA